MRLAEPDAKGAVEEEFVAIDCIDGFEVLGYRGEGREEHSGENAPTPFDDVRGELADNGPDRVIADALATVTRRTGARPEP